MNYLLFLIVIVLARAANCFVTEETPEAVVNKNRYFKVSYKPNQIINVAALLAIAGHIINLSTTVRYIN